MYTLVTCHLSTFVAFCMLKHYR